MPTDALPRRRFVGALATATTVGVAGCLDDEPDAGDQPGDSDADDPFDGDPPELESRVIGDGDSLVEVFADYRCPHCKEFERTEGPELRSHAQDGSIRYVTRDLPVPVHPEYSWRIPNLPRSAQAQTGSVETAWDVAEYVWEHDEGDFDEAFVHEVAAEFDLDEERTWREVLHERYRADVEADRQRGVSLGVQGTPAVVVDDELLEDRSLESILDAAGVEDA